MLDYKLIEALSQVVLKGGFDNAANALNLTQSAVSYRIKLLEDQVGQILLKRTTPPTLTIPGQRLLKLYQQVKHLEQGVLELFDTDIDQEYIPVSIGVNIDSLTTWLIYALQPLLEKEKILLHVKADFQQLTYGLLKNGDCVGIITTEKSVIKGCFAKHIGKLSYRIFATPEFQKHWFPNGLNLQAIKNAPAVTFGPTDKTLDKMLDKLLGVAPSSYPQHHIPSVTQFSYFIVSGMAYGVLTDQQSAPFLEKGSIINMSPKCHVSVDLYWHCWNLETRLLNKLTKTIVEKAKVLLHQ